MATPRVLVLRAPGTNCDEETAHAWSLAGAKPSTWPIARLLERPEALAEFQVLTIPGGFSYGDDLGAGQILAARLRGVLAAPVDRLLDSGGLVLGICNGFQVLVRAGLLPGGTEARFTLARNESARFEARWVRLASRGGSCPFIDFEDPIELPVAHGEGRLTTPTLAAADQLVASGQAVLRYADDSDTPTLAYPANPNGSLGAIAGVCDPTGRIFGLMPHPERYTDRIHHPRWTRGGGRAEPDGLRLFRSAVRSIA
jgi:phosphoribosylformylglycinamidine synthase